MGCGKSKHDVVTGNTSKIKKPLEGESVKGKETDTVKRQRSCRCQKTNDISAAVSDDQPKITVEIITKKPKENEAGGDRGDKTTPEETNGDKKPEEKEPSPLPPVTIIEPENVATEEKETTISPPVAPIVPENVVTDETETTTLPPVTQEEKETTTSPTVTAIVPENDATEEEETILSPPENENVDEQKEKIETVTEEEKSVEGKSDDDADTQEVEELKSSEVEETLTTDNEENVVDKENDENQVSKDDENKVEEVEGIPLMSQYLLTKHGSHIEREENPAEKIKEAESA